MISSIIARSYDFSGIKTRNHLVFKKLFVPLQRIYVQKNALLIHKSARNSVNYENQKGNYRTIQRVEGFS